MARVKRGTTKHKKRKALLKKAKGYRFGRRSKKRQASEAVTKAGAYAFAHRRKKKGVFRREWQVAINAAVREHGLSYSAFMNLLKKKDVALDRKSLAEIARTEPGVFNEIVESVK